MTTELMMLVGVVAVFFCLILLQSLTFILAVGPIAAAGNREELSGDPAGLAGRVKRTVNNHLEGLVMFAPLVLIISQAGLTTPATAMAAQVYLGARIAHALTYIAGIIWVRTIVFVIGMIALVRLLAAVVWG